MQMAEAFGYKEGMTVSVMVERDHITYHKIREVDNGTITSTS